MRGKRENVLLQPVAMGKPGLFAISQQWPEEGRWVLRLVGKHPAMPTSTTTLVKVNGESFERGSIVMKPGELGTDAVEAMLR